MLRKTLMTSPSPARSAEPWQEPATLVTPLLFLPPLLVDGALLAQLTPPMQKTYVLPGAEPGPRMLISSRRERLTNNSGFL